MTTALAPRSWIYVGLAVGLALAYAHPALAQTTGGSGINPATVIQNLINLLNNNLIRGLAVLAVMATGAAWLFGRLDLHRAGVVVVGIILLFGAATIVDTFTGSSGS